MQSLKTAFVVILLGAMLYGIYVVINTPPNRTPRSVQEHLADGDPMLDIEMDDESAMEDGDVYEPAPSKKRLLASRDTSDRSKPRQLAADESQEQPSPAERDSSGIGGEKAADRASPSLGPDDRMGTPLPSSDAGRDAQLAEDADVRAPVGLEQGESVLPPKPPVASTDAIGGGPTTIPVPELKSPTADGASFVAAPAGPDRGGLNSTADSIPPAPTPPPVTPPPLTGSVPAGRSSLDPATESVPAADGSRFPASTETTGSTPEPNGPEATPEPVGSPETSTPNASSPSAPTAGALPREGVRFDPKEAVFERSWKEAQAELAQERPRQALFVLSQLYADPRLTPQERKVLHDALDPLAGRVIYSNEHLLEQPYEVRKGDTLPAIAELYRVPWQLLANINGVNDPTFLVPGTKLKVIRGPFKAEVDLTSQEITIYLNQLYAGRFPVSIGFEPAPEPGEFEVKTKEAGRDFATSTGQVIPNGDAMNPYGNVFLDLGRNLSIHGSASAEGARETGCISLSPRDAQDVFGILSVGSTVTIRR